MKDIIPAKKQSPILGLTGMGGGVGSNIVAGGAKKTYVEDVFSNWTYRGNNQATQSEQNGIDLSDKGGFCWIKDCDAANNHVLFDTERGVGNMLRLGGTSSANETVSNGMWAPASNGFTHGNWDGIGQVKKYASWTWAKQEGFFDVVKWTGNGVSGRQIPHNLGSVPGFVMTKALDNSDHWRTLHSWDFSKILYISADWAATGSSSQAFTAAPDATNLYVTADGAINANGQEYIAYIFAGGPSTAAGAHSVYWPAASGQTRRIRCGDSSNKTADFNFGTGDLTIECWIKCGNSQGDYPRVVAIGPQWANETNNLMWDHDSNANRVSFYCYNHSNSTTAPLLKSSVKAFNDDKQWHHIAVTRSGNIWRLFVDGIVEDTQTWTGSPTTANSFCTIGNVEGTATTGWFGGYISNVRIVKGTAVYTSSFRVPTEPLTSVTNTKLLCCNNLSATAATVTPIALTEEAVLQNQTENPFLDPESFKFGEEGDQNLIKCGSYLGNTTTAPEIYLGWEPQYIMIKCVTTGYNWATFDNIRGMVTGGNEAYLYPNLTNTEYVADRLELTPTGFKIVTSGGVLVTDNGQEYIYVAIRRPDPLVAKPIDTGTDALFMATGDGNNGIEPKFRSSDFPVDFMMMKTYDTSNSWLQGSRLAQAQMITSDSNSGAGPNSNIMYDYMDGWGEYLSNDLSAWDGWGFRRHAGMDVVCYKGNSASLRQIPHNLAQTPEMIWIKASDHNNTVWAAGHKGLNNGVDPWDYWIRISGGTQAESTDGGIAWGGSAPTSTHFSVGGWTEVNNSSYNYWAFLFASVTGVSKLGYYTGDDTTDGSKVITTGFQPRFLMVKCVSNAGENWNIVDSHRGLGAGNDKTLKLNAPDAQNTANVADVSATGFSLRAASGDWNALDYRYIYYAHA